MKIQTSLLALTFLLASSGVAQSAQVVTLDGDYKVELTIGSKVFIDEMTLKGKEAPIELNSFIGDITGTMTVPGMFTSPLEGVGSCLQKNLLCQFHFSIVADENGQTYKVSYSAVLSYDDYEKVLSGEMPVTLKGSAYLEDGKVLGDFVATKQ